MKKRTPLLSLALRALTAGAERSRLAVEFAGAALIVCAVAMVSIPVAIALVGVILVVVANFYMGSNADAGTNVDGSEDQEIGR